MNQNEAEETRTCGPLFCTGPLSGPACGSPSEPSGPRPDTNPPATGSAVPGTEAPAADDSLQKVLDAGKLTIAAEGNWVPYVYNEDGTGELTGFEVDIAKEICSRLGVEPDFQISSSWDPGGGRHGLDAMTASSAA